MRRPAQFFLLLVALIPLTAAARDNEPQWMRVNSSHFTVVTDAGERKGHDVIVRFEQMRGVFSQLLSRSKVNMSLPIDIIALKTDKEYAQLAPIRQGQPINAPGFFIAGDDRIFIVLDVAADESWRAVAHQFAHYLLNYNYPATPAWFDEGFAEYFSSMRPDARQVLIGGDPELNLAWKEDLIGNQIAVRNVPKSLTEQLTAPVWLSMSDLFDMRHNVSNYQEGSHNTLFYAQSWITMHFLLNTNRLPQTGMLFDLVMNQKMPVNDAIQKAYGMTAAEFEKAVKDYFHAQKPLLDALDASKRQGTIDTGGQTGTMPLPITAEEVGTSRVDLPEAEGRALVAEMSLRLPEHRAQTLPDLVAILSLPKGDTSVVHRALGWAHLDRNELDAASEELNTGFELDRNDPWVRYYLALVTFRRPRVAGQPIQGLANAQQDLRAVIDWAPSFAEAYAMLGRARLEGGGINSAMESMRMAIQLNPRDQQYLLDMAHIDIAGKKWDDATALLEQLKTNQNPQIARIARKDLDDLPTLRKYGILPQNENPPPKPAAPEPAVSSSSDSSDDAEEKPPAELNPDTRRVQFAKGKLVAVDCSHQPIAVLTVTISARKSLKLRTEDYKSLTLVGADQFSCTWKNRPVSVNYKAGGKSDGDLISLEVQ
jgi:tetratricopeptide (TPR) repeat protein